MPEVVTLPFLGTLTTTEVHAFVIGLTFATFVAATRARPMVRTEPWYFLGGLFVGALVGLGIASGMGWVG